MTFQGISRSFPTEGSKLDLFGIKWIEKFINFLLRLQETMRYMLREIVKVALVMNSLRQKL
jgi:hypothetical protein